MTELLVSHRADEELRQIWRYIAAENPAAADRLLLCIDSRLQILRDFPDMGMVRDDILPGCRVLVEGHYLILYEHNTENRAVEIVTVIDARRDLAGSL